MGIRGHNRVKFIGGEGHQVPHTGLVYWRGIRGHKRKFTLLESVRNLESFDNQHDLYVVYILGF